jgi:hypothetical protein
VTPQDAPAGPSFGEPDKMLRRTAERALAHGPAPILVSPRVLLAALSSAREEGRKEGRDYAADAITAHFERQDAAVAAERVRTWKLVDRAKDSL